MTFYDEIDYYYENNGSDNIHQIMKLDCSSNLLEDGWALVNNQQNSKLNLENLKKSNIHFMSSFALQPSQL